MSVESRLRRIERAMPPREVGRWWGTRPDVSAAVDDAFVSWFVTIAERLGGGEGDGEFDHRVGDLAMEKIDPLSTILVHKGPDAVKAEAIRIAAAAARGGTA